MLPSLEFVATEALPLRMSHFNEWSHLRQIALIALIVGLYFRNMVTILARHLGHWRFLRYLSLIFDDDLTVQSL